MARHTHIYLHWKTRDDMSGFLAGHDARGRRVETTAPGGSAAGNTDELDEIVRRIDEIARRDDAKFIRVRGSSAEWQGSRGPNAVNLRWSSYVSPEDRAYVRTKLRGMGWDVRA